MPGAATACNSVITGNACASGRGAASLGQQHLSECIRRGKMGHWPFLVYANMDVSMCHDIGSRNFRTAAAARESLSCALARMGTLATKTMQRSPQQRRGGREESGGELAAALLPLAVQAEVELPLPRRHRLRLLAGPHRR